MQQSESQRGDLSEAAAPLIRTAGLTKRYPGVLALDRVDFDLKAGEVHVLFGENGAGKSTLISLLAGANRPTSGDIWLRGNAVQLESVHQARRMGISAVFQEFSLVPQMTVAENIFLGAETTRAGLLDRKALRRSAEEIIARLGFPLKSTARVQDLSRAEQQMVEITKAFRSELSVLILDEPTASLTERETDQLFRLIEQIKRSGVGVIYITHRMQEIKRIGDRITVLRDGRYIATLDARTAGEDQLVRLMTGRVISEIFPTIRTNPGEEALRIESLSTRSGNVTDASLSVRKGEVVGLAGLLGSGKSEAMRAAFGIERMSAGRVFLKGKDVTGGTVASISGVTDDAVTATQALLANFGVAAQDIPAATQAALDLSAAFGIDLTAASRLVGQTMDGTAGRLAQLVPEVGALDAAALRSGEAIRVLGEQLGGQFAASTTNVKTQLEGVNNDLGELAEAFGVGLTGATDMAGAVASLRTTLQEAQPAFQAFGQLVAFVFERLGQVGALIGNTAGFVSVFVGSLVEGQGPIDAFNAALAGIPESSAAAGPALAGMAGGVTDLGVKSGEARQPVTDLGAAAEQAGAQIEGTGVKTQTTSATLDAFTVAMQAAGLTVVDHAAKQATLQAAIAAADAALRAGTITEQTYQAAVAAANAELVGFTETEYGAVEAANAAAVAFDAQAGSLDRVAASAASAGTAIGQLSSRQGSGLDGARGQAAGLSLDAVLLLAASGGGSNQAAIGGAGTAGAIQLARLRRQQEQAARNFGLRTRNDGTRSF